MDILKTALKENIIIFILIFLSLSTLKTFTVKRLSFLFVIFCYACALTISRWTLAHLSNWEYIVAKGKVFFLINLFMYLLYYLYKFLRNEDFEGNEFIDLPLILFLLLFSFSGIDRKFAHIAFIKEKYNLQIYLHIITFFSILSSFFLFKLCFEKFPSFRFTNPSFFLLLLFSFVFSTDHHVTSLTATVFARLTHDVFHWVITFLILPDHPYLSTFVWNIVGLFFKKNTGVIITYSLYLILSIFICISYYYSMPGASFLPPGIERRLYVREKKDKKRLSLLFLLPIFLITSSGFIKYKISSLLIYDPSPEKLIVPKDGIIKIPVEQISDKVMHKYEFEGKMLKVRFIVLLRPDGNLSVTLDACNICPPEGYAQIEGALFCKYCGTPIPLNTVGLPGGCNPVPVRFEIDENFLILNAGYLEEMWKASISGK